MINILTGIHHPGHENTSCLNTSIVMIKYHYIMDPPPLLIKRHQIITKMLKEQNVKQFSLKVATKELFCLLLFSSLLLKGFNFSISMH